MTSLNDIAKLHLKKETMKGKASFSSNSQFLTLNSQLQGVSIAVV